MSNPLEAKNYNINDTIHSNNDNFVVCINNGEKMWKKFNPDDELKIEEYLIGNQLKEKDNKKETYYSNVIIQQSIKTTSAYHQFLKDKTKELSLKFPNMIKKERYSIVLSEWKKVKK